MFQFRSDVISRRAPVFCTIDPIIRCWFCSLIANDSWKASFSQLSDRLSIFVFCRTGFIWNSRLLISSSVSISKRPVMGFHAGQVLKCLFMALLWCIMHHAKIGFHWFLERCTGLSDFLWLGYISAFINGESLSH